MECQVVKVYKLESYHRLEPGQFPDIKLIGFFRSEEACSAAMDDLMKLPGFREPGSEFAVEEYVLPTVASLDDIQCVYYVQRERPLPDDCDEVTEIGLFLTDVEAQAALRRFQAEEPAGDAEAYIDRYPLDQRYWQEGFDSYR